MIGSTEPVFHLTAKKDYNLLTDPLLYVPN